MKAKADKTFRAFDYKWARAPGWTDATAEMYSRWWRERYGHEGVEVVQKARTILDAACGQGRDAEAFAIMNPEATIIAMDQSESALTVAKKRLQARPNCVVVQDDITTSRQGAPFDLISCDQALHHTPEPVRTLRHFIDLLVPRGVVSFSVPRKKNNRRDLADDLIMQHAQDMDLDELWEFARAVTQLGKALYDLGIRKVSFDGKEYPDIQRFVHNHLFRCWYHPGIDFELSVSSNFDWFSGNPRLSADEVRLMLAGLPPHSVSRWHEEDAVISVTLRREA